LPHRFRQPAGGAVNRTGASGKTTSFLIKPKFNSVPDTLYVNILTLNLDGGVDQWPGSLA
jgi:hypothetical protein